MRSINIETKEVTYVKYITRIDIRNGQILLNDRATFEVWMFSPENDIIAVENVTIEGEEYSSWSSDDNYIYSLILEKLGMTELPPAPEPAPEPTPTPDPTPDTGTSGTSGSSTTSDPSTGG